ncbi:hypothetical protein BDR22DRAFT_293448 [Usnea florida]
MLESMGTKKKEREVFQLIDSISGKRSRGCHVRSETHGTILVHSILSGVGGGRSEPIRLPRYFRRICLVFVPHSNSLTKLKLYRLYNIAVTLFFPSNLLFFILKIKHLTSNFTLKCQPSLVAVGVVVGLIVVEEVAEVEAGWRRWLQWSWRRWQRRGSCGGFLVS